MDLLASDARVERVEYPAGNTLLAMEVAPLGDLDLCDKGGGGRGCGESMDEGDVVGEEAIPQPVFPITAQEYGCKLQIQLATILVASEVMEAAREGGMTLEVQNDVPFKGVMQCTSTVRSGAAIDGSILKKCLFLVHDVDWTSFGKNALMCRFFHTTGEPPSREWKEAPGGVCASPHRLCRICFQSAPQQ